jgi:glycine betaine/proline transport system substrate-binding protein
MIRMKSYLRESGSQKATLVRVMALFMAALMVAVAAIACSSDTPAAPAITKADIQEAVSQAAASALTAEQVQEIVAKALADTDDAAPKPTIRFADTQFESLWINNAIAKFVIEEGFGYPVETIEMSTPVKQVSLANGDVDVDMELWKQNIIEWYTEEVADGNIIDLGMTYEGGPQFFMVPQWVADEYNIKTVFDMKDHWELFENVENPKKGAFINCIIGWQCAEINRAKLTTYGLTEYYDIISPGSSGAMEAALVGAMKKNQPVFGYYWAPTAVMGAYKWQILEEPAYTEECWVEVGLGRDDPSYTPAEACAYETLPISKGINSGLLTKAPEIVNLLSNMNVGLQPINETASWAKEEDIQGEWERAAIYYLQNYQDRWTTWMTPEKAEIVKTAVLAAQ